MPGCCAFGCTNRPEKGFLMKVFPRDPVRRKQWADMVKREGWSPTNSSCLCEAHFEPHMWEKVREDGKRVLKRNAVPTIFSYREPPNRRKPPVTQKPCSPKEEKYAGRQENTSSSNPPDTAVTDSNVIEKLELMKEEWLPDTEESSTYKSHDIPDNMNDSGRISRICSEPEDNSRLIKIKEEQITEEIWIKSDPADEEIVKREKDTTTMLVPKVEREISPCGSYEDFERDASRGTRNEVDESGSLKDEMSVSPLTGSAGLPVECKETVGSEPYFCDVCKITFKRCEVMKKHMLIHFEEKPPNSEPYSCDECKITFKRYETMEIHKLIHSQEKPHSCLHCNQTFFLWDHLVRHLKEHRMNIIFSCTVCNKTFTRKTGLREHMSTHSLTKLFSCTICESKFACKSSLYRHMTIHAEDRKEPCPICGRKFLQRGMKIHMFLSHARKKS